MASPSMLATSPEVVSTDTCHNIYQFHYDWLLDLDQRPELLITALEKNQCSRLGYYFEHLVAFWLQQRLAGDYFESHLRVFEQKRVIGEFDFLFTPIGSNQLVHWETAVKFYLQFTHDNGDVLWYGPNARDRLDIKVDRVLSHQLRLGNSPQGRALLQEKGFATVQAQTFFKGYLFYPVSGNWLKPQKLPDTIALDHLKGWWTYINRLELPDSDPSDRWKVLPRLEWLATRVIQDPQNLGLMDKVELRDFLNRHFASNRQSLLIAQMIRDTKGHWQEKSRGFVVSRNWPANCCETALKV